MNIKSVLKLSAETIDNLNEKETVYRFKSQLREISDAHDIDAIQQKLASSFKNMTNAIDRIEQFGTVRHSIAAQTAAKELYQEASQQLIDTVEDVMQSAFTEIRKGGYADSLSFLNAGEQLLSNAAIIADETQDPSVKRNMDKFEEKFTKLSDTINCLRKLDADNMQDAPKLRMAIAPVALPILIKAQEARTPKPVAIKPQQR